MLLRSAALTSTLLALVACGSEVAGAGGAGGDPGAGGDGGGDTPTTSSSTTGGEGGAAPCPEGATYLPGVIVPISDDELACLETDTTFTLDLCVALEEPGTGFRCFESEVDGRRVWLPAPDVTPRDAEAWSECTESHPDPLPPCFNIASCVNDVPVFGTAVTSTCNEQDTRDAFQCGSPTSPWDEQCCPRTLCDEAGGCPGGLVCSTAGFSSYLACSRGTDGTCGCFGTADAQEVDVCVSP